MDPKYISRPTVICLQNRKIIYLFLNQNNWVLKTYAKNDK